jgi:serine/threonine protein kinase
MCRQQVLDYRAARPGVDVWATAATLYRMLTGATPRDFPPGAEPVLAVLQSSAVPVRSREPSLPARLAAVIDAALVDDPDLAVTSAGEFRAALAGAL